MAELSPARERYWRYAVTLTAILLAVWVVVVLVLAAVLDGALDGVSFLGFPAGHVFVSQAALIVSVIEIAIYARLMNARDRAYLSRDEGA